MASSSVRATGGVVDPDLMRHTADLAIDYLAGLTGRRGGSRFVGAQVGPPDAIIAPAGDRIDDA